jgi:hypothetical protein
MTRQSSTHPSPRRRTVKITLSIPIRLQQEVRAAALAESRSTSNFVTVVLAAALAARSNEPVAARTTTRRSDES